MTKAAPPHRYGKTGVLLALLVTASAAIYWRLGNAEPKLVSENARGSFLAGPQPDAAALVIDSSHYRKTSEFDPGTLRVYLRNDTRETAVIKKVLLDGVPLRVWGINWEREFDEEQHKYGAKESVKPDAPNQKHEEVKRVASVPVGLSYRSVVWARLAPAPILAGGLGEFSAKLPAPMSRPMKLEFIPESGEALKTIVWPNTRTALLSGISFSQNLDTIYLYVKNESDAPLKLERFELNGKAVTTGLTLSSRSLGKGQLQLAVVKPAVTLVQGQYLFVKALFEGGATAEERVRVFSGFPITTELGEPPTGFGLDPERGTQKPHYFDTPAAAPNAPSLFKGRNYIFDCPTHAFGSDKMRSAFEILKRHDVSARFDPLSPCVIHLCRVQPQEGYALFAETTDILEMNPAVFTHAIDEDKTVPSEMISARLARLAYLAARPKPLHALADTAKFGSEKEPAESDEIQRRVYASLAQGSKGVFYRHYGWGNDSSAVNSRIRSINAELNPIRDLLAIAEPVDWVHLDTQQKFSANALLAGDRGVVLIIVSHAKPDSGDAKSVRLKLDLPAWCVMKSLKQATPEGLKTLNVEVLPELELPVSKCASIYVLEK